MAILTVEGVPDALVARLARAAAGNGRCLNSEVILHLARATAGGGATACHAARDGLACWCVQHGHRCRQAGEDQRARVGWGGPACGAVPGSRA